MSNFSPVDYIVAKLRMGAHRTGSVALVVTFIDLLRRELQPGCQTFVEYRRWFDHDDKAMLW